MQTWVLGASLVVSCAALDAVAEGLGRPGQVMVEGAYPYAEARTYSYYAAAAYCSTYELSDWECVPCRDSLLPLDHVRVFEDKKTDARAFVGKTENETIVLAVRGSHTIENFIADLEFFKADKDFGCTGCKVHKGFYETWRSISADVLKAVGELHTPGSRVVVVGHSLGAAVATLAVYDLISAANLQVHALHTFGSPRVGNADFAEHMWRQKLSGLVGGAWRHTHWRDPVVHLPLEAMHFKHVPTEVWFDEDSSSYTVCDGSGEDQHCADSRDVFLSVNDHLHYFGHDVSTDACQQSEAEAARA